MPTDSQPRTAQQIILYGFKEVLPGTWSHLVWMDQYHDPCGLIVCFLKVFKKAQITWGV